MFPWKYSPFLQTKPALFPLSVTRPYLLPAGPENFLPIKLVLKTSCTLEAPAQPAASSTPHARNQPLYRLTMAVKYLVQRRGKKTYKMPRSFSKHFLLPHIYAKWFAAFGGTLDPHGSAQVCPLQRTDDFGLAVTLSSCKLASSGFLLVTAREDVVLHQQVMKRMDKHPEGTGWMVPATPQPKGYPLPGPALIPQFMQASVQDLP